MGLFSVSFVSFVSFVVFFSSSSGVCERLTTLFR